MSFGFKQFTVDDSQCGMKISTDGVLLGAWVTAPVGSAHVLDVGTGSGLIAMMIAQRALEADIVAVDIDEGAVNDARSNFLSCPFANRLNVRLCDFTSMEDGDYDLIVSNPPFFTSGETSPEKRRAAARHVSSLGYVSLIERASAMLTDDGRLAMILPAEVEEDVVFNAELARLKVARLCRVQTVAGKPSRRFMVELSRHDITPTIDTLTIRDPHGCPTPEYMALTADFYLNF